MSDLMALDIPQALELRNRMEAAADDLEWDAQALEAPLAEASYLLGGPVPNVPGGARRVAGEIRDSALDLQARTHMVLAGGPDMNEGLGALERIREHFTMIESRDGADKADGLLSRGDLLWAVHSADSATAEAAEWLLEHEHFFDQVETAHHNDDYLNGVGTGEFAFDPEDRDGLMSLKDIDAFMDKTAAWAALLPHAATIDAVTDGQQDGFMSREDFETFLAGYQLPPEVASAVQQVLDDGAYHTKDGGLSLGLVLDAVSFVPVIGDVVDGARAIYYALHGDFYTASLFALGLVPLPGLSGSGLRGAVQVVGRVAKVGRKQGRKAAIKEAGRLAMKGTAANYAAHEATKQATGLLDRGHGDDYGFDIDETVDYVWDEVVSDRLADEDLHPAFRQMLSDDIEESLADRFKPRTRAWVTEANTVIARRVAESHAFEAILRNSPG